MSRRPGGAQHIPRPTAWADGDPSPWNGRESEMSVAEVLARVPIVASGNVVPRSPTARLSAVLVALVDGPRGAEVLLTKRSATMRNHRGEISFPGGRMEPGESAWHAAQREANEEVLLDPATLRLHGELGHVETMVSTSYIIPMLAGLDERPVVAPSSTGEVDRVLWVPLVELAGPDTFRSEQWGLSTGGYVIHFYELDDETIWGATGRILYELLTLAYA